MCVRTWRKISAPGRLGQQGKHSPSNVLNQSVKRKTSVSGPNSPNDVVIQSGKPPPKRQTARQLFKDEMALKGRSHEKETTPGEVAISYLLSEFSFYAHRKIEKVLLTVNHSVAYFYNAWNIGIGAKWGGGGVLFPNQLLGIRTFYYQNP